MSRFWKIALAVVLVLVVAGIGFRLLHKPGAADGKPGSAQAQAKDGTDEKDKPVPVTVVPVARQDVPVYLTALGTVQALNTVTINPQVSGRLISLDFAEGREVKKGEVLAQIDPRTFQAAYDQATAKKRQDQAQLATARSNYSRSNDPKYSQYVSKVDQDTQRNTVAQFEAAVASDNAAIQDAQVQLGYTKVLSPIDGLAGIRGVDPGNVVTPTSNIVTLTQLHPINVMFTLPEQDLDLVRGAAGGGDPLEVTALDRTDAHPIASGGVLKVIDNQIDVNTGTFRLKSEFANAHNELWPGQFVNVRMKVRTVNGGLVIPTQAVQRGPDGDYVYVVQADNTVKMQPVTVAGEVGDSAVMVSLGLKQGERVVTEGQFRLKPGSKVNALKPGEVPAAPTTAELEQAKKKGKRGSRGH
jgi:membrane fusion protein, multidrug efflux system